MDNITENVSAYLNLYLSTKATAMYFPESIRIEISWPVMDLHCKTG